MTKKLTATSIIVAVFAAGYFLFAEMQHSPSIPAAPQRAAAQDSQPLLIGNPKPAAQQRNTCPAPAGWIAYQIPINETVYSLALRNNTPVDDLLSANCLEDASGLGAGSWLYVPASTTHPQTLLPLGISALVVDPLVVPAGGTVNITWQTQGPVVGVRVGWLYGNQFIEEAANLPQIGTWAIQVPTDGRESITFMLRATDGLSEIAAQTTVRVYCPEGWFFAPAPTGCPYPPLITTFHEQLFERGRVIYVPALGVSYMLPISQPARRVDDSFAPGMPLTDPALEADIPPGMAQPSGPINYAWRADAGLMAALGYAISDEVQYAGMLQRTVSALGETVYFSASSGDIYRFANNQAWQILAPQ